MPSTTSRVVSIVLDSSTVMTPSLPTFFMASAMMPPICLSLLAEMVPTWAIMSPLTSLWSFLISSTATSTALSMPRLRAVGLAPAATVFTPSRKMAWARTVAVVVPSPATSLVLLATSRTICAPMFSRGSRSSISLATVTPSLVMMGAPNFFSITALRPLGPRVIFTASARAFTPRRIAWREFSPVTICFAISWFLLKLVLRVVRFENLFCCVELVKGNQITAIRKRGMRCCFPLSVICQLLSALPLCCFGCAAELGENFFLAEDQQFFAVDFDFAAAVLAEQHTVANVNVEGHTLALLSLAGTDGDHFALLRLFLRGVGDDDAALDGFLLFDALHDHTVVQRCQIDCHL